jgi:hypothetical protein
MKIIIQKLFVIAFCLALVSCDFVSVQQIPSPSPSFEPVVAEPFVVEPPEPAQTQVLIPVATITPIPLGPINYPYGINPLTGLAVSEPANLSLPPVLASISNFPPTARPQAGLSFSPIVFELFIGDGMTRNLAVFYGDYPEQAPVIQEEKAKTSNPPEPVIGPIRSGRISYEKIRQLFNGFLVMASAYKTVAAEISQYTNVFGSDSMDVNSAMLKVSQLVNIAKSSKKIVGDAALSGMVFDPLPPEGGEVAHSLWVYYSYKNQIFWRYNESDGFFHRFQDNADGSTFIEATDRLNAEALKYSNVIVLFVKHDVLQKYVIDLDLLYKKKEDALLFRDGKVYKIYWTTRSEEYEQATGKLRPIRFIDNEGNPFPLKPGQTWIQVVPLGLQAWETVNSEKYNQLMAGNEKGSGYWALRFKDPTL